MGRLSKVLEGRRIAQTIEVMRLMAGGASQDAACKKVGISKKTYQYWIASGEEAVEALRRVNNEIQRSQMEMILTTQKKALELLLQDVVSPDTDPRDRLAILAYLDRRLDALTREHSAQGQSEDAAAAYLTGPKLIPGQSRLRGATVNVNPRPDGSVDITTYKAGEIVEGHFVDHEDEE
jgi:hypothetical protein